MEHRVPFFECDVSGFYFLAAGYNLWALVTKKWAADRTLIINNAIFKKNEVHSTRVNKYILTNTLSITNTPYRLTRDSNDSLVDEGRDGWLTAIGKMCRRQRQRIASCYRVIKYVVDAGDTSYQ